MVELPSHVVIVEGLDDLSLTEDSEEKIRRAAARALNQTAKFARADAADEMRRAYNFPGSYLDPSKGRLVLGKAATSSILETMVVGRKRATSLGRFIVSSNGINKQGVIIEMLKGRKRELKEAFPVSLRQGDGAGGGNLGLAVRTKDGKKPENAYKPIELYSKSANGKKRGGAWLLYGISVNQAFRYSKELTADRSALFLESEMMRLLEEIGL